MERQRIPLAVLAHGEGLGLPSYATPGSSGVDLRAAQQEPIVVRPLGRALIPTGFAVALPAGLEAQVRPRSGLALEHGLTVLNSPGTIDSDYRGEIKVILANLGDQEHTVTRGQRIAQLVFAPVLRIEFEQVADVADTGRGSGGFGHTGSH